MPPEHRENADHLREHQRIATHDIGIVRIDDIIPRVYPQPPNRVQPVSLRPPETAQQFTNAEKVPYSKSRPEERGKAFGEALCAQLPAQAEILQSLTAEIPPQALRDIPEPNIDWMAVAVLRHHGRNVSLPPPPPSRDSSFHALTAEFALDMPGNFQYPEGVISTEGKGNFLDNGSSKFMFGASLAFSELLKVTKIDHDGLTGFGEQLYDRFSQAQTARYEAEREEQDQDNEIIYPRYTNVLLLRTGDTVRCMIEILFSARFERFQDMQFVDPTDVNVEEFLTRKFKRQAAETYDALMQSGGLNWADDEQTTVEAIFSEIATTDVARGQEDLLRKTVQDVYAQFGTPMKQWHHAHRTAALRAVADPDDHDTDEVS